MNTEEGHPYISPLAKERENYNRLKEALVERGISQERCVEIGGHCWEWVDPDQREYTARPLWRMCKHCGKFQHCGPVFHILKDKEEEQSQDEPIEFYTITKPHHISEVACLEIGGHCMEAQMLIHADKVLLWCKHCGHEQRRKILRDAVWQDVEEKETSDNG